jgi:predicted RNA-binding protein with PIN domain
MPVLIDGNNLLFAARDADPERPPSRSTLCLRLGQWARRTGETVVLVFDGPAPAKALARQISDPDVGVSYSGAGVSADEVLMRAIAAHSAPKRLLVVSSDNEIARAGRRRRAKTVGADAFWRHVQRDLTRPPRKRLEPGEKNRGLPPEDARRWLSEFGLDEGQADAGGGPAGART